jgi:hypothetical protein
LGLTGSGSAGVATTVFGGATGVATTVFGGATGAGG